MRSLTLAGAVLLLLMAANAGAQVPPPAPTGPERGLPSAVIAAFQKDYPAAKISGVETEREGTGLVFRVDSIDRGKRRLLVYTVTGSVLESSEQVEEKDLPKPVVDAIHSHKKAQFVRGMKITRSVNTHYELTLKGSRKTTMIVTPDGTVIDFK